ncbi:MAG: hypothetical protein AAF907_00380, partial [Planctomycetota bacterium]
PGTALVGGGRPSHAWFTGFATGPDGRTAAVCVLLEHGGDGVTAAGPVAKDLLETWAEVTGTSTPSPDGSHPAVRRVR